MSDEKMQAVLDEAIAERDAARAHIAAALACHTRGKDRSFITHGFEHCAECGKQWDSEADRCTSATVTALLGGGA